MSIICSSSSSVLYLTRDDLTQIMNDEVIVVAEGVNGTVMKANEVQVSIRRFTYVSNGTSS